jgi:hypothetical protein
MCLAGRARPASIVRVTCNTCSRCWASISHARLIGNSTPAIILPRQSSPAIWCSSIHTPRVSRTSASTSVIINSSIARRVTESRSRACTTATGRRDIWERSASSDRNPGEEHRRAANGYLAWPVALANIVREDEHETIWSRLHARQALVLGVAASLTYLVVLALPLLVVLVQPSISAGTTIVVYGIGLAADVIVGLALLLLGVRYAARAARGELFSIPGVTSIVDRWFRVKSP